MAAKELGKIIYGVDDDVEIAVVVEVAEGTSARGDGNGDARAGVIRNVDKPAIERIFVEQLAVRVAVFGLELLDFGIDVAVANEDVGPAVIVHVEKTAAQAEILCVPAEAGLESGVFEIRAAEIAVQRRRVAGEICFDEIEIAVEIVIGGGDAHAGLRFAVGTERAAGFDGDVREGAVFLVLIESAGRGIVCDVNVRPAVVVEIGGKDTETVSAGCFEDAGFFADVGKGTVAVVVIENVFATVESRWTAGDHNAFVEARAGFGNGRGFQVEIDVIGDEKIEVAIAIVVDKSAAGVPALAGAGDACFFGDVGEGGVAVVVVENIFAEVGDEKIVETVVVVIADADALSPARMMQAGFGSDVGEGAVAIVFEKMRNRFLASRKTFEAPAVDEENIQPAVVVVIVKSDTAAGGFEKVFVFVLATENGFGVQAGLARNVEEGNTNIAGRSSSSLLQRGAKRKQRRRPLFGKRQGKKFFQREDDCATAERS